MEQLPLVSVGIPTYNRPKGLRRTLDCITSQTYPNLEIIVSDNCSPGEVTQEVVAEFAGRDPRIRYFRQNRNRGAHYNFRFVFRNANGKYFMWASDDDEWDNRFVEYCLDVFRDHDVDTVMCQGVTKNRSLNLQSALPIPLLRPEVRPYENIRLFLERMSPSLIYGLHRKESLEQAIQYLPFDWWDCSAIIGKLCAGDRIFVAEEPLYFAGVDTPEYVLKPTDNKKRANYTFSYRPFALMTWHNVIASPILNVREKASLTQVMVKTLLTLFNHFERKSHRYRAFFARELTGLLEGTIRITERTFR